MLFSALNTVTEKTVQEAEKQDTGWILHHVMDGKTIDLWRSFEIPLPHIEIFGIDFSITRHVLVMWLAAIILILVLTKAAKSYKKSLVPRGSTNFIEVMIVFIRDEIARPTIGIGYEKFMPYLLTVFFFILTCNFLGLIPGSATATSNIAVTSALAIISFFVIQIGGMIHNGAWGYFKGLVPHGLPFWLVPIIFLIEILGLFTKPFALAIRLFANMTAGHVVIGALIGLIIILQMVEVAFGAIPFALFVFFLEILVALIQAYIFTMLSSLFIGMAVHQEH